MCVIRRKSGYNSKTVRDTDTVKVTINHSEEAEYALSHEMKIIDLE